MKFIIQDNIKSSLFSKDQLYDLLDKQEMVFIDIETDGIDNPYGLKTSWVPAFAFQGKTTLLVCPIPEVKCKRHTLKNQKRNWNRIKKFFKERYW